MKQKIAIGIQSFSRIRESGAFYIDKTDFIREWWENEDDVTLITRPRRFGKTLNLDMLSCFLSDRYAGRGDLFEGLKIWDEPAYRVQQGTWPVLHFTFAGLKPKSYEEARRGINQVITAMYSQQADALERAPLSRWDREFLDTVTLDMPEVTAAGAIRFLASVLSRVSGKRVILLLDEYDTPMEAAYVNGYWDEMTDFMRQLFENTFKVNPYMHRALITGITRIARESLFSGLNNLEVVSVTSGKYASAFGFTGQEVREALRHFGMEERMEDVRTWYDGFCFGSLHDMYNPWSITKFLEQGTLGTYWVNTSSNSLVGQLVRQGPSAVKTDLEKLLAGESIRAVIDEEIVYAQLDSDERAVWSLLLATGYLKVEAIPEDRMLEPFTLSLTNREVQKMFRGMITEWFHRPGVRFSEFVRAMLDDNVEDMNYYMNDMASRMLSFFDSAVKPSDVSEPERFWHGFVLGLVADARLDYEVTSNRESGRGRYDVMLTPRAGGSGHSCILEFKVFDPAKEAALEDTVQRALAQIREKQYDALLIGRGVPAERIRHYGFAFRGKDVLIGGE